MAVPYPEIWVAGSNGATSESSLESSAMGGRRERWASTGAQSRGRGRREVAVD
jgi:hypothetical protein